MRIGKNGRILPGVSENVYEVYAFQPRVLGQGVSGMVTVCLDKQTGEKAACKTMSKLLLRNHGQLEDVTKEVAVLRELEAHPNVVHLKGVFEDSKLIHLVEEICNSGTLFEEMQKHGGRVSEKEAKFLFWQLLNGVAACHAKGWMHRDLKLENVMLSHISKQDHTNTEGETTVGSPEQDDHSISLDLKNQSEEYNDLLVKLIDFGMAANVREKGFVTGRVGSPHYMAPEVIGGKHYATSADMWSCGIILYCMLAGYFPFNGRNTVQLSSAIMRGELKFRKGWESVSPAAKNLVAQLVKVDPKERLSATEALDHPWLQSLAEHESLCLRQMSGLADVSDTGGPNGTVADAPSLSSDSGAALKKNKVEKMQWLEAVSPAPAPESGRADGPSLCCKLLTDCGVAHLNKSAAEGAAVALRSQNIELFSQQDGKTCAEKFDTVATDDVLGHYEGSGHRVPRAAEAATIETGATATRTTEEARALKGFPFRPIATWHFRWPRIVGHRRR
eukprot:TRINITY_DN3084_c0_g1_i1.p1 TRINITY_DN3084_c0_g1~~TRINITY_DN3084_c0_g1_i1.p1  ORF type:complete len:503 (+),score=62.26 TRINITY_DN3084_c0_g1_i1:207-1715(+)